MTLEQLLEIIDPEAMEGFQRVLSEQVERGVSVDIAHHYAYNKWGRRRDAAFAKAKAILVLTPPNPPEAGEQSGWRLMESAPKKIGEFVDLWAVFRILIDGEVHTEQAKRFENARWVNWATGKERWIDSGANDIEYYATDKEDEEGHVIVNERVVTHWQPLPASPSGGR